jgi:hypothetical protein
MLRKIMIVLVAGAAVSGATTAEAFHGGGGQGRIERPGGDEPADRGALWQG